MKLITSALLEKNISRPNETITSEQQIKSTCHGKQWETRLPHKINRAVFVRAIGLFS